MAEIKEEISDKSVNDDNDDDDNEINNLDKFMKCEIDSEESTTSDNDNNKEVTLQQSEKCRISGKVDNEGILQQSEIVLSMRSEFNDEDDNGINNLDKFIKYEIDSEESSTSDTDNKKEFTLQQSEKALHSGNERILQQPEIVSSFRSEHKDDEDDDEIYNLDKFIKYDIDSEESAISDNDNKEITLKQSEIPSNSPEIFTVTSRNKSLLWSLKPIEINSTGSERKIQTNYGISAYAMQRISTIRSSFDLCFTPTMCSLVINELNYKGKRIFGNDWKEIDTFMFRAYLGLCILTGIYKSDGQNITSLWDENYGRPLFRTTMSIRIFENITRVLQFDYKISSDKPIKLAKSSLIQNLFDKWIENIPNLYVPYENLIVDEQLIPFGGGKFTFRRQHMLSKPIKCELKNTLILIDAKTNFIYNIQPFLEQDKCEEMPAKQLKNPRHQVVLDLVGSLNGRNIITDNYFTSYELAVDLLKNENRLVGSIHQHKNNGYLPAIGNVKKLQNRELYSSDFFFSCSDEVTLIRYSPVTYRSVTVLSTLHHDKIIVNHQKKLPEIIDFYVKAKMAVSNIDKLVYSSTINGGINKWPTVFFSNIIDMSCINAYALFMEFNPYWTKKLSKRKIFLEQLGKELIDDYVNRRKLEISQLFMNIQPQSPTSSIKMNSQNHTTTTCKQCQICQSKKIGKASSVCNGCNKYQCGEHKIAIPKCTECMNLCNKK